MYNQQKTSRVFHKTLKLSLLGVLLSATQAFGVALDLAREPLQDAVSPNVRPNLMYILDNSGSMSQDYTPDYMSDQFSTPSASERQCKDSGDDGGGAVSTSLTELDMCVVGDVPFMTPDLNVQYYNPEITYTPAVNGNGSSFASQTNPASVRTDPFNRQNSNMLKDAQTNTNLTTEFPDRLWCTINNPTAAQRADTAVCRTNTAGYTYPDATFRFGRFSGTNGPNDRQNDAVHLDGLILRFGTPYYYRVVPTEHCKKADLKECTASSTPTGEFVVPARSRWCDSTALTNCQGLNTTTFRFPRYIGAPAVAGVAAVGSFRIATAPNNGNTTVTSIRVNGVEILNAAGCGGNLIVPLFGSGGAANTTRRNQLATAIANRINSCNSSPEYIATSNGASQPTITITSTVAAGATANGTLTVAAFSNSATRDSLVNVAGGVTGSAAAAPYTFVRTSIVPATTTYPKASTRTDCAGSVGPSGCSYTEEMTNFSNWYSYYRTRMQGMKTATSRAFKDIGGDYRVGFITISNQASTYLPVSRFVSGTGGQKETWYTRLFSITPSSSTPLRSALTTVGRIFAGVNLLGQADPMEYACQGNYALLTTDGYWNTDSDANVQNIAGGSVGNPDGATSVTLPKREGGGVNSISNSLADAAMYYANTDLRTTNCTGVTGLDVCGGDPADGKDDVYEKQVMKTFTLGLGIDGTLLYSPDYQTAATGDFADIKAGTKPWPRPVQNEATTIDDLWHAAVNGDGQYFSAKDANQIVNSLNTALQSITISTGSSAAAATSTLRPVSGNNNAFIATYTTQQWTGNIVSRKIDIKTGFVTPTITWCVEDVVGDSCTGSFVSVPDGGADRTFCSTEPVSGSCAVGVLTNTPAGDKCYREVATSCSGQLKAQTTRKIFMNNSGSLQEFEYSNMDSSRKAFFDAAYIGAANRLSQWSVLTTAQRTTAAGNNLVKFLRGESTFEQGRSANTLDHLYRYRVGKLGDIVSSNPEFVGAPEQLFLDPGYAEFKDLKKTRKGIVYVGANDGMLHAFNSETGVEEWAFVPSEVMKNMWKLADKDYANRHDFFVNGSTATSDVCVANCDSSSATWKTILVGSLGRGGRSYFALDVTNPDSPSLLWEFDTTVVGGGDPDLGYSYARANFAKNEDGDWVVLLTSGYNNMPETAAAEPINGQVRLGDVPYTVGNGGGYLYVLDPSDGSVMSKIGTGEGDTATPSGLRETSVYSDDPLRNKTALHVYAGDLLGNLYNFNIDDGTVKKLATFKRSGKNQPITTVPILGEVDTKRVIFFGTGQYLQQADRTNVDVQSIYAFKDDDATTISDPRSDMVEQGLQTSGSTRTSTTSAAVDFSTDLGWFVDVKDEGERSNISGTLVSGTLSMPTNVPDGSDCEPSGYGYLNRFDFKTGLSVLTTGVVSTRTNAQSVGSTIVKTQDGYKEIVTDSTGRVTTYDVDTKTGSSGFNARRAIWREMVAPTDD